MTGATLVTFTGGAAAVPTVVGPGDLVGRGGARGRAGRDPRQRDEPDAPSAASFKVLPKITVRTVERDGRGARGRRRLTASNLKVGSTTPTVKVGTLVIPPGLISISTLTQVGFHGAGGGAVGQDHDHDGGSERLPARRH